MADRRILTLERPGVAGMFPDLESYLLDAQQAAFIENGLVLNRGVLHQRRAWSYLAPASARTYLTIGAHEFSLAGVSRLLSSYLATTSFGVRIDPTTGAATDIFAGNAFLNTTGEALLRCVYKDQAVYCHQDGLTPMRFYSGAAAGLAVGSGTLTYTAGRATVTLSAASAASADRGAYVSLWPLAASTDRAPTVYPRIVERNSSTLLTMEDIKASVGGLAQFGFVAYDCGWAYPCVSVYDVGTGTLDPGTNTFTGSGTKWFSGAWGSVNAPGTIEDGLLRISPTAGGGRMYHINSTSSDTVLSVTNSTAVTDAKYHICRRLPGKDAAAWGGGLATAGVYQHPNRVYISKPDWNPALPPLQTPPYDPSVSLALTDPEEFLLDYIEVPAPDDDDPIVAILPTENQLDVLKERSSWGIYGRWSPGGQDFEAHLLAGGKGVGCMDIRSARAFPQGRFWVDRRGIYRERGGQIEDLARNGFSNYWRSLAQDFHRGLGDRCAVGLRDDHLFVSIDPRVGTPVTLVIDLRPSEPVLASVWTNHQAIDYAELVIPSLGLDGLYWVGPDAGVGRVANSGPILAGTGIARDADGDQPNLKLHTGSGLARAARLPVDARLLDVRADVNIHDTAGTGSTMAVSLVDSQRLNDSAPVTTALGTIASKATDGLATHKLKAGIRAEQHQVRLEKTATQITEQVTEVARLAVTFRDSDRAL